MKTAPSISPIIAVPRWLVLGSFPMRTHRALGKLLENGFACEADFTPAPDEMFDGRRWTRYEAELVDFCDGALAFPDRFWCYAYAFTYLHSPVEQTVRLLVGSDKGVALWLNGALIHKNDADRGLIIDEDTVPATLRAGWNRLVCKVSQWRGAWALSARVADATGLTFALDRPADAGFRGLAGRRNGIHPDRDSFQITLHPRADGLWLAFHLHTFHDADAVSPPLVVSVRDEADAELARADLAPLGAFEGRDLALATPTGPILAALAGGRALRYRLAGAGEQWDVPLPADAPAKILLAALLGFEGEARADFTFAVPPLFRGQPARAEIFSAASDEQLTRAVGWPVAPARAVSPAETATGAVRLGLTAPVALPLARTRLVFGDDATQELIRRLRFWTKDLAAPLDGVAACLAAVSREDFAAVCRELAALEQAVAARQPDRRAQTVTLVGHAHIDVNWLWTTAETIQCCHDTFRQVLAFMEEFPEFRFSHSQALAYQYIERLDPPMFERIRQRVREGRWELLGGMYVESDTNLPSGEGLARSFLYGQRYFREKFERIARVGWLPDNFGHVAQLPQLLALAGIGRFYAHRCQPRQGSYRWRGIDGTACHAVATAIYYGEVTAALRELPEQTDPQQQRAMWVYGVCDHGGGPTRRDITRALAYRELPGFPWLEFGTAETFFRAIEARGDELPVHHGELQYVYEGCYTSIAGIKAENRRCENTLFVAEQLATFLTLLGGRYPAGPLAEAWRAVVLNQFHDILCGSAVHESNRESLARYAAAREKAEAVRHAAWRELAARVRTRADAGQPVVVFNPLPRARTDIVAAEVFTHIPPPSARLRPWMTWGANQEHPHRGQYPVEPVDVGQGPYPTVQLTDGDGQAVDAQIVDGKLFPNGYRCQVRFLAENLPACGYRAYYVKPTEPAKPQDTSLVVRETVIESRFFRVEVDGRTGHLTRLFDKRRNVEVLAPGGAANVLKLYMEKPHVMSAWDIGPISAVHALEAVDALRVLEKGPLRAVIEVARHWNRSTFFQRILVHRDLPFLDFELDANWFELGGHTVDAPLLRVAFPLHVAGGVFTCDTPFAAVERPRDGREVPAQKWVDLSAPGSGGAALLNDSKYGHRCLDSTVELSLLRAPYEPDPYPDQGPHHIRYRLFPHAGDWRAGRVAEAGLAFNIPLLASETPPNPSGALPPEGGWFEIESDHCYLAAIKQAEDGDSWIVRVFEGHGHGGTVGIVWPFAPQRVERVDLLEDPLPAASPVATTGCRLEFPIRAHEIVTLRIR